MSRYLSHSRGLASRRIGDEEVVVSPRAGKVWSLNEAGALVWELADGSLEAEAISGKLSACRHVGPATAADELDRFAVSMIDLGLMEWRDAPTERSSRSRRAEESLPPDLAEAPGVIHEEQLQVLAGACDSNHSGQGAACMLFGSCASAWT
ncbi:MAG: PqqD family protein [Planctomycetota bacterium]|jgi:hypothetical protein